MELKKLIILSTLTTFSSIPTSVFALGNDAVKFRIETRANYRHSEDKSFAAPFPPNTFLATVDPGDSFEVSNISLLGRVQLSENWLVSAKVDVIDLYERNPTTGDRKADLDSFIVRYGTRHTNGLLPEKTTYYGQIGKFGKFERQEDRHLESYGLVSTAFNRLEDSGVEFGIDFPSGLYTKLSYTTGAPLFFRDPNAMAGDNGVEFFENGSTDPKYNSGVLVLYDAEVESFDLSENPEIGGGLGYRWISNDGYTRLNVLLHYNKRTLANSIELHGTGYGGDLDLLQIKPNELPPGTIASTVGLPVNGNDKTETGLTLWLYHNNFSLFAQYVDQEIAELDRTGWEIETSYALPRIADFVTITPAIRYSRLDPDFSTTQPFPAQSVWWDWEKLDYGVNFDFNQYVRLTIERSNNKFVRSNKNEGNHETLATLLLRYDF